MRVLLTGAMGNIGLSTLKGLLAEGHEVVAFDLDSKRARKSARSFDERVRFVWGDITDRDGLRLALDGVDAVVHLAAIIPPLADNAPDLARRVNLEATVNLIAEMEASPTAKRLVFASSMGIFGDIQDREPPLRVDTPVSPTDEYGRQKIKCEEAIRESGLQWSILRLAAVTPIQLKPQDPTILFEFSPDARMEFLHPDDAGTAFARAVACEEAVGKILFLGGGANCQTTYVEFATALLKTIGLGPVPIEAFARTTPPRFYGDWLDTEESQRLLQFQTRDITNQIADMKKAFGLISPIVRLVRPLATWYVVRKSPFLEGNKRASVG
ncbi:NAD-dependent epimerase/dehydratase family protein [Aldersonia kunmingensis]|uniref:NAD-dependent epimerase/dehydratase family protein n=1 Tax=Aldersonia kunmingensis TaxID=408066 RepID=UPI0008304A66|nr:NAD(P)-dependent oxidoreductase [Aldersonia kunmingensis]